MEKELGDLRTCLANKLLHDDHFDGLPSQVSTGAHRFDRRATCLGPAASYDYYQREHLERLSGDLPSN